MTKTQEHKLIVWALLAVAVIIILWLLFQGKAGAVQTSPADTASTPTTYTLPPLSIPGNSYVINAPASGLPNIYEIGTPPPAIAATNGDCSCGCGSNGDGSVTYSFGAFNTAETNIFDQLQTTADAADQASMTAILQGFGYNEGVFVGNATPTPWAA